MSERVSFTERLDSCVRMFTRSEAIVESAATCRREHLLAVAPGWTTTIRWNGADVLVDRSRFYIQFNPERRFSLVEMEQAAQLLEAFSPSPILLSRIDKSGFAVFNILEAVELSSFLSLLRGVISRIFPFEAVSCIEPDRVHRAFVSPNDPFVSDWPYPSIRACEAWQLEAGDNPNITIGIIDTGLTLVSNGAPHPDLDADRFHLGGNYVQQGPPIDDNLHGTMVTGIAAAQRGNGRGIPGMTSGTRVHICKTLRSDAHGVETDFNEAVREIVDGAIDQGKKVIVNYSAGGRQGSPIARAACNHVRKRGMLLCAAAGDADRVLQYPAAYSATNANVLSVGGINEDDQPFGPTDVDVFAPAVSIRSTKPNNLVSGSDYGRDTGTSLAAAFVTGLAALVWSCSPTLSANEVKQRIKATCRVVSGRRIIDAAAALA